MEFLDSTLLEQPSLYPDQDTKRRLHPVKVLPQKQAEARDLVWERFRTGT